MTVPVTVALTEPSPPPRCRRITMRLGQDVVRLCGAPLLDGECLRHGAPLGPDDRDPLLDLPVGFVRELWEHEWISHAARGMWPPAGYRYVWVDDLIADRGWRVATPEEAASKGCRFIVHDRSGEEPPRACGAPPVVALMRTVRRREKPATKAPWFYCRSHAYGHRWVAAEDGTGQLLAERLVEGESPDQVKVAAARDRLREAGTS